MEKEKKNEFHLPEYYENRELSWLKFDARVLNEAKDKSIPLLERLKFVSITSSNLDEFFMVRVASLKDMVHADYRKRDIAGMTASEQLDRINTATRKLVESQYNTYNRSLVPLMAANGIHIIEKYEELTAEQAAYVDRYFEEDVYPVLTPMAVDASRPFFPARRMKSIRTRWNLQRCRCRGYCLAWCRSRQIRRRIPGRWRDAPLFSWSRLSRKILISCF